MFHTKHVEPAVISYPTHSHRQSSECSTDSIFNTTEADNSAVLDFSYLINRTLLDLWELFGEPATAHLEPRRLNAGGNLHEVIFHG